MWEKDRIVRDRPMLQTLFEGLRCSIAAQVAEQRPVQPGVAAVHVKPAAAHQRKADALKRTKPLLSASAFYTYAASVYASRPVHRSRQKLESSTMRSAIGSRSWSSGRLRSYRRALAVG